MGNKGIPDLRDILESHSPIMFDGVALEGEVRQKIVDVLSIHKWFISFTNTPR